jgi:hypothetical protein
MRSLDMLTQHPITKTVARTLSVLAWLALYAFGTFVYHRYTEWNATNRTQWADKNCPGLLSITRSSRDTLNLMRSVTDCTGYVFRTLE